jgi:hypothetical protein
VSNFKKSQHATHDLFRRLQLLGRLMGQAAGSAAPPAGWPQFGNLTVALRGGRKFGCKQYTAANAQYTTVPGGGVCVCGGARSTDARAN